MHPSKCWLSGLRLLVGTAASDPLLAMAPPVPWWQWCLRTLADNCRYSSCHFSDPPKVQLASGQSFASIEVEPGQQVWLGNVDIKVAFYAMQLPAELIKYFGLPYDVRTGDVGVTQLWSDIVNSFMPIRPDTRIVPVFAAIPMGWTHSLAVCQAVLEGLSRKVAGITADNRSCHRPFDSH